MPTPPATDYQPVPLQFKPGIQRDGTEFASSACLDGQWVRWQRGVPRKIGGYGSTTNYLSGISRQLHVQNSDGYTYVHSGWQDGCEQVILQGGSQVGNINDRTPVGFTADVNNGWQWDAMWDAGSSGTYIIGHAAPYLNCICDDTDRDIYAGDILGSGALTAISSISVSGGIVALHPYLFAYGNDGFVAWSVANQPTDFTNAGSGDARIASTKIVRGLPLRGGSGNSPAGLLWSLDNLLRVTFVGGTALWDFDTISSQSSILSPNGVIEYDGVYFWPGVDRFMFFNGVLRDMPNDYCQNYFFDNLNYSVRSKVFAFKVPRYGEIWWCYPRGSATECSHAVIFNTRENCWYDTTLPGGGRSAAMYAQVFRRPLVAGVDQSATGYTLWQHEYGVDDINGNQINPIQSYFTTPEVNLIAPEQGQPQEKTLSVSLVEPDFVQDGPLSVTMQTRANARAPLVSATSRTITATASSPDEQVSFLHNSGRLVRFRFESNSVGGDYQMGKPVLHLKPDVGKYL